MKIPYRSRGHNFIMTCQITCPHSDGSGGSGCEDVSGEPGQSALRRGAGSTVRCSLRSHRAGICAMLRLAGTNPPGQRRAISPATDDDRPGGVSGTAGTRHAPRGLFESRRGVPSHPIPYRSGPWFPQGQRTTVRLSVPPSRVNHGSDRRRTAFTGPEPSRSDLRGSCAVFQSFRQCVVFLK